MMSANLDSKTYDDEIDESKKKKVNVELILRICEVSSMKMRSDEEKKLVCERVMKISYCDTFCNLISNS